VDPHDARRSIEVRDEVSVVHNHSTHDIRTQDLVSQDFARLAAVVYGDFKRDPHRYAPFGTSVWRSPRTSSAVNSPGSGARSERRRRRWRLLFLVTIWNPDVQDDSDGFWTAA